MPREPLYDFPRIATINGKRHDARLDRTCVTDRHPVDILQALPQTGCERLDAYPEEFDAAFQCVVNRHSHAELGGRIAFPVFEPPGACLNLEPVRRLQHRRVKIEKRRLKLPAKLPFNVKEAYSAGSAQIFPASRCQHVASGLRHIKRDVPHSLAGIEKKPDADIPRDRANRLNRLYGATVGRNNGKRDKLHTRAGEPAP